MAADESMEEWLRTVLEERHCMDCKVPAAERDGTREFHCHESLIPRLIRPNPCAYVHNAECLAKLHMERTGDSWVGAAVVTVVRAYRVVESLHRDASPA